MTSAISSLRPLLRDAVRVDLSRLSVGAALRNAIGVVLPLALGAATGHLLEGLTVSTVALNAAFSDRPGPYRLRAAEMLLTGLGGALSVFVGGVTGSIGALAVALTALWGFAAGLLVSLGLAATQVGLTSVILLLVFGARPLAPGTAAATAALLLGGAALQTALSVAAWPLRRFGPQRDALAAVFRRLAAHARAPEDAGDAPAATAEITAARTTLAGLGGANNATEEALRTLLDEAERIRLALLALDDARRRLRERSGDEALAGQLSSVLDAAGDVLSALADGLDRGRAPADVAVPSRRVEAVAHGLRRSLKDAPRAGIRRVRMAAALARVEALGGQLRAAVETVAGETPAGAEAAAREEEKRPRALRLREPLATLRANLTPHSAACRHALRLAGCLAAADALGRVFTLPRSYWIPLTAAIVLKPDFAATFTRGVVRVAGTLLGLVLITALVYTLFGELAARIALVGVFMFAIRGLGPTNYGILVSAVTALVVVLTSFAGANPATTIVERGVYTLIGGAIALGAYAVWPTWERTQVSSILAGSIEAYRRYFVAVMAGYLDPTRRGPGDVDAARQAARLARTNAEASVDRLRGEPSRSEDELDRADGMLAASHRLAHSVMAFEAGLYSAPAPPAPPQLHAFVDDIDATLGALVQALCDPSYGLRSLPNLRADQRALADLADPEQARDGSEDRTTNDSYRLAVIVSEADRVTDSVNTMTDLARRPRGAKERRR